MNERPPQPPEGRLIGEAAERLDLSIREAARRAGISYGRWRQIVQGYQNVSPGSYAAVRAPAKTLAKMARVVGVDADAMESEGQRPDAAELLRRDDPVPAGPSGLSALLDLSAVKPAMSPAMAAAARPHYVTVAASVAVAEAVFADRPLRGEQVFPDSGELSGMWDRLAESGLRLAGTLLPPGGWTHDQLAEMLAIALVRRAEQATEDGQSAG